MANPLFVKLGRRGYLSRGGETGILYPSIFRRGINLKKLLDLYLNDPITKAAVEKRALDLVAEGFELYVNKEKLPPDIPIDPRIDDTIVALNSFIIRRALNFKWTLYRAIKDSLVFGAGVIEIVYSNDDAPSEEPPNGSDVESLVMLNPMQVVLVEDDRRFVDKSYNPDYGKVVSYIVLPERYARGEFLYPDMSIPLSRAGVYKDGIWMHPARIEYIAFEKMSDSNVGQSQLESIYNILRSKTKADRTIGTILERYAKPVINAMIEGATPDEIRKFTTMLDKINKKDDELAYIVHDEFVKELNYLQGSAAALNPMNYYKIMMDNIATAFKVPRALLVGLEAGSISGSDLNLISYFEGLRGDQEAVLEPVIISLCQKYADVAGLELPETLEVDFGRQYADEIALYKGILLNMQSAANGYNSGLITLNEARKMIDLPPVPSGDEFHKKPTNQFAKPWQRVKSDEEIGGGETGIFGPENIRPGRDEVEKEGTAG